MYMYYYLLIVGLIDLDPLWFSALPRLYLALCEEVGVFLSCRLLRVQPLHGSSLGSGLCLIGYGHIHISTPR
jgi:hypothetical protein